MDSRVARSLKDFFELVSSINRFGLRAAAVAGNVPAAAENGIGLAREFSMSLRFFGGRTFEESELGFIKTWVSTYFVIGAAKSTGLRAKSKYLRWGAKVFLIFSVAARLGVEPRQNESESFVLPLHHRAVKIFDAGRTRDVCGRQANVEPAMGFEPATACLQNRCSTIELRRRERHCAWPKFDWEKTLSGGSPGTRTPNQLIKSQLLYH